METFKVDFPWEAKNTNPELRSLLFPWEAKSIQAQIAALTAQLTTINRKVENLMATIDQIAADVTAQKTALAGLNTLISGLKQQIADALSGATLPPAVQSKVDAVFTDLEANNATINAALAANVPPAPSTP